VSEQKYTTKGISVNTQFCKHSVLGKPPSSSKPKLYVVTPFPKSKGLPKIDETHALSKPVTSNSIPTPQESKFVKNDNVIAPGMFRINPFKPYREEKYVPKKVRASVRTNPITVLQLYVITKKDVNSDSNGLSSTGVDNTAKTRRPQPRNNTKNDRAPSASKSSCSKNKEVEVEKHPRNLLFSKIKKHMSSECNNVKLAIRNDKSKVVCAMCKQCLITANHDVCVLNYVNDMNSRGKKQKSNVSNTENQKKQKPKVMKPKKVGSNKILASPKPSKPRSCLRWSPTERLFNLKGKIIASSEFESPALMVIMHVLLTLWNLQSNGFQIPLLFLAGKSKRASYPPKPVPNSKQRLHLLYMDLCGPMRIAIINGKRGSLLSQEVNDREDISEAWCKAMAFEQRSSGLDLTYAPSTITTQQPTEAAPRTVPAAQAPQVLQTPTATTTTADTAPTPTNSSSQATNFPNTSQDVGELETQQHTQHQPATIADNVPNAIFDENTFVNPFATPSTSVVESSSSQYVDPSNMHTFYQPYPHEYQ
ncbi:hypothetical protein Tco_1126022, partial [Tanacetum coccineum]